MGAGAGRRPRAKRGEGELLREEILAAASQLLLETGDEDAVGVRAVAAAVGVSPPAIYLHFADKDELVLAVCARQFQEFDEFVEARVAGAPDPFTQLQRRARAYVQFGLEHPEHYRIMFMGRAERAAGGGTDVAGASGFDHLVDNVRRCIEAGGIRDEDPVLVATGLWAVAHGVTSLAISVPGFPPMGVDALLDHVTDVAGRGLLP